MSSQSSSTDRIREKKKLFLNREQRIISAALELFLSEGIDRVTVSKIAAAVGIGKGTVYKHFLTKNEILIRIMLDYEHNITNCLAAGIAKAQNGDSGAAAKGYFEARLARPELDRLVQHLEVRLSDVEDIAPQLEQLHKLRRSNEDSLNGLMSELIDKQVLEDVPPHFHYLACWQWKMKLTTFHTSSENRTVASFSSTCFWRQRAQLSNFCSGAVSAGLLPPFAGG